VLAVVAMAERQRLDGRTAGAAARARLADRLVPHWPILTIVAAYTWYFTRLSLDVHRGLGTAGYDFGLYDQGLWLASRFRTPYVTIMGRNLFGDHTSFILIFLIPLYWVAPGAWILLFSQALAIGSSALPIYFIARRKLGGTILPTLLGSLMLLHPATGWTNMEMFHPDCYLGLLVGLVLLCALTDRWRWLAVFVVLTLMVKEDTVLLLAPLGVWVWARRNRRAGIWIVLGSIAYAATATLVVMRNLIGKPTLNAWRIPFGGPTGLLTTAVRHPGRLRDYLGKDHRPWYVWQMLVPYAGVYLLAWDTALISSFVLASNVISTFVYQHLIQYHYSLIIVPPLCVATVLGIARLQGRRRTVVVTVLMAMAIWTSHLWGILPISRNIYSHWPANHPVAEEVRRLGKAIPPNAVVSAQYSFVPQIDRRVRIYQFPVPYKAVYWSIYDKEGQTLPFVDQIEYVFLPKQLPADLVTVWDRFKDRYVPLVSGTYTIIWVRKDLAPAGLVG